MGKTSSRSCGKSPSVIRRFAGLAGLARLAGVALIALAGCSKSSPPAAPPPPPDTNTAAANAPQPAPASTPPPVVVAPNPDGGVDLKALNHAYIGWVVQNRRAPKSFEDFVSMSGIKVPPPPPGKKYVIDNNGFINLVNQ